MGFIYSLIGSFIGVVLADLAWRLKLSDLFNKKFPTDAPVGAVKIMVYDGKNWEVLDCEVEECDCDCGCSCCEEDCDVPVADEDLELYDEDDEEEDFEEDEEDEDEEDEEKIPV